MSQRKHKQYRRTVKKQADAIHSSTLDEVFIHISAKPFWARLKWCLKVAFKRHSEQKRLAKEIKTRKSLKTK